MALDLTLAQEFAKASNNSEKNSEGYLAYGTVREIDGNFYVELDGSDVLTPVTMCMGSKEGDRVSCTVKDHTVTINTANYATYSGTAEGVAEDVVTTITLAANEAMIGKLAATEGNFSSITADSAFVKQMEVATLDATKLVAKEATIDTLSADTGDFSSITADSAFVKQIFSDDVSAEHIEAVVLEVEQAKIKYVEADNAYIIEARINDEIVDLALLRDATISQGSVTGYLDAVLINAESIKAGTLTVDRLLIKDDEGNYKLATYNEDGELVVTTMDGSAITENTITTAHLVADAVTSEKIAANAVTTEKILAGAVTADEIAAGAVTADKIAANAVTAAKIDANAITAEKIDAGAITTDKLAANAVTAAKIDVTDLFAQTINATGSISGAKLYSGTGTNLIAIEDGVINMADASSLNLILNNKTYKLITFGTSVNDSTTPVVSMGNNESDVHLWGKWIGMYGVNGCPLAFTSWDSDASAYRFNVNGHALTCDTATSATTADEATSATNADNATKWNGITDDHNTNNTADTWVPVFNGSTLQHRVIPTAYNGAPSTLSVGKATTAGNFAAIGGVTINNSTSFSSSFCKDIFGSTDSGYYLKEIRTNSNAPSSLLGGYASGIAWKGSDTYGSLMTSYGSSNIRVSGGNGTNPTWTVDLVHSGNIGSQTVSKAQYYTGTTKKLLYSNDNELYCLEEYGGAAIFYTTNNGSRYVSTGSWSDSRLKDNVEDASISGLDVINAIRHRTWDWNETAKKDLNLEGNVELGYVAHELKEVVPEAVVSLPQPDLEDFDELYQVDDTKLIRYMTKAIQELSAKVDALEKEVATLKGNLAE